MSDDVMVLVERVNKPLKGGEGGEVQLQEGLGGQLGRRARRARRRCLWGEGKSCER